MRDLVFRRLEPLESYVCPDPRPKWRGVPLAELDLARDEDGRWLYRAAAFAPNIGFTGPLGYWVPGTRTAYPSREAAIEVAVARIRTLDRFRDPKTRRLVETFLVDLSPPKLDDLPLFAGLGF